MDRKAIAGQSLNIQERGYYELEGRKIDFAEQQASSEKNSFLLTPDEGLKLMAGLTPPREGQAAAYKVVNRSAVDCLIELSRAGTRPGVLNFASAKNPGGGFLNGAMAQEEALAASSGLYKTLLLHPAYYERNRAHKSMMYTHHAIYSPEVVFFRDGNFNLLPEPALASVLTLPAVNMGQVILKGENTVLAKQTMEERMRLCLAIFASQGNAHLILGAYGCGVFRNDPNEVAAWWNNLLRYEGYGRFFEQVIFAVFDRSKDMKCFSAFDKLFAESDEA